ncbi:hypothetical protein HK098_006511 [Nowakowskiella sp. JEL0407]|nr:hypothetical protein HK098_006511 [Nowakowskiella sp. JEL0407]
MSSNDEEQYKARSAKTIYFTPLQLGGKNFAQWIVNADNYIASKKWEQYIRTETRDANGTLITSMINITETNQAEAAEVRRFLLGHIERDLTLEYTVETHPAKIWKDILKLGKVVAGVAASENAVERWNRLKFSNYKDVNDYHREMLKITADLKRSGNGTICTEELRIRKTLRTFPPDRHAYSDTLTTVNYETYHDLYLALLDNQNSHALESTQAQASISTTSAVTSRSDVTNFNQSRQDSRPQFEPCSICNRRNHRTTDCLLRDNVMRMVKAEVNRRIRSFSADPNFDSQKDTHQSRGNNKRLRDRKARPASSKKRRVSPLLLSS